MLKICINDEDIQNVLNYIGKNYYESLYLYLDAKKYGVKNSHVKSWIQCENGIISSVVLMYHNGFHIYSDKKSFDVKELCCLIKAYKPTIICGEASIIHMLSHVLCGYKKEFGFVAKYISKPENKNHFNIRMATRENYRPMAEMLHEDTIGEGYLIEELINQIEERIADGFSRSYCLFDDDNNLVAQASTGAEEGGIATIAYVITAKKYRGKGYGKAIVKYLCDELASEKYETYLIYYSKEAGALYLNNGFENVCEYGKLYYTSQ